MRAPFWKLFRILKLESAAMVQRRIEKGLREREKMAQRLPGRLLQKQTWAVLCQNNWVTFTAKAASNQVQNCVAFDFLSGV
jgi:hypothetical protein